MRAILTVLTAFFLAAGLTAHADAGTYKKKRLHATPYGKYHPRYSHRDKDDTIGGYYEHRLEAVRFGSQRWWKIYEEQSGGNRR
jgi:hypothetical protein